jgi:D-alanine-D-alanine ligase
MDIKERIISSASRVAILCGGSGSEREVSLVSGRAVAQALTGAGVPCDLFELEENAIPSGLFRDTHLVLPVVHGSYGEDGRLSAELDYLGYAYAGCDQASSVLCFDKLASKAIARHCGIPVARDRFIPAGESVSHEQISAELGEPYVLKPRRDGSSVGLHLVRDAAGFDSARDDLAGCDYLAETYIEGCDLTTGLLGERVLGTVAVYPQGGLYDYAHKYTAGLTRYEAPADIPASLEATLRDWSGRLFRAFGCRDLARVDYRLGDGPECTFLEINTLPGMTPTSLLPKAAQCAGISFEQLVIEWTGLALERKEAVR